MAAVETEKVGEKNKEHMYVHFEFDSTMHWTTYLISHQWRHQAYIQAFERAL